LLRQATVVLMQAVPDRFQLAAIEQALTTVDGVLAAHDLHVWAVTSEQPVLSAHLTVAPEVDRARVMADVHHRLRDRFGLRYSTVQLDCPGGCGQT
jgi:cobalt-zinc-cadmium efflux system protein